MVEYCGICHKSYKTRFEKFYHYEFEHNEFCPICDKKLDGGKAAKVIHIQFHGEYSCSNCWRIFERLAELTEHVDNPRTHLYRCNKCHLDFNSNSDMWLHYEQTHSTTCALCFHRFSADFCNKLSRDEHFRKAHDMFPCRLCYEVFSYETDYNEHFNRKHRVSCASCIERFPDHESKDHHFVSIHQVKCQVCERQFNTQLEFQHHYNDVHRVRCDTCQETFPDEEAVRRHNDRNHKHQCNHCSEIFTSEMKLQLHYIGEHQWKCTICHGVFESAAMRLRHVEIVHQFPCSVCSVVLDTQEAKHEHTTLLHQMKCDVCDKMATTIAELQLHYDVMHQMKSSTNIECGANQKGFKTKCSICDGEFANDLDLVEHYRKLHINFCDGCDMEFQFLSQLTTHKLQSHQELL